MKVRVFVDKTIAKTLTFLYLQSEITSTYVASQARLAMRRWYL